MSVQLFQFIPPSPFHLVHTFVLYFGVSFPTGIVLINASLIAQLIKNPLAMQETPIWFLGWVRSPVEGKGYPLQYSGLENSMKCIVHGVSKSRPWLSNIKKKRERERNQELISSVQKYNTIICFLLAINSFFFFFTFQFLSFKIFYLFISIRNPPTKWWSI